MKNKVLATLLAVCLFAGLAVPAFAAYSSVEGDPYKVSIIEFTEKEVTIAEGATKDIAEFVKAYEDKNTYILDKSALEYSLEGDSLAFGINGSEVTAVDKTGTATVVVKSSDGKTVAKLPVKAAPASTRYATGFRFKDTVHNIPVNNDGVQTAEDVVIKVSPVPAGATFTSSNLSAVATSVSTALTKAATHYEEPNTANFAGNTTTDFILANFDLPAADSVVFKTAAVARGISYVPTANTHTFTLGLGTTAAATTYSLAEINAVVSSKLPGAKFFAIDNTTGAEISSITAAGTADATGITIADGDKVAPTIAVPGSVNTDGDLEFKIAALDAKAMMAAPRETVTAKVQYFGDKDGLNVREVTANTSFQTVPAVPAKTVGAAGTMTIEVGETIAISPKFAPSSANVGKTVNYTVDFANDTAITPDFAIVANDGKVTGIKVGSNKIIVSHPATGTSASIVVNVVARGTKPAPATGNTTVLSAWAPKLGVGETANIVVKADGDVTYKSLNEAVATVDAAGKITAVKEGVAKISVQEEGKDIVYLTVTVGATTTKPEDKPTDVPQTAVAALVALF